MMPIFTIIFPEAQKCAIFGLGFRAYSHYWVALVRNDAIHMKSITVLWSIDDGLYFPKFGIVQHATLRIIRHLNCILSNIDECRTGKHDCQQLCNNLPGTYNCSCNTGFILNWTMIGELAEVGISAVWFILTLVSWLCISYNLFRIKNKKYCIVKTYKAN